jgi:hypothetical protein
MWTPFQTHCFSENLVVSGVEPGTSESAARNSDHYTTEAAFWFWILSKCFLLFTCRYWKFWNIFSRR